MRLVNQILLSKGNQVWTIPPKATVFDALQLMAEHDIGALLVVEDDDVVGICSERDYARKLILHGKSSMNTSVDEIMTREVVFVSPDLSVAKCMALMTEKHIRHLPVLDNGRLVGIISIGDVVKAIITEQQIMIDHLEDYIYS